MRLWKMLKRGLTMGGKIRYHSGFLHVEGDASTICVLSHDLAAADNQTVASFTHTDVNNCIIRKEKNVFDRAEKTDFSMEEACAIDDTGKDYQEYVIRISY